MFSARVSTERTRNQAYKKARERGSHPTEKEYWRINGPFITAKELKERVEG